MWLKNALAVSIRKPGLCKIKILWSYPFKSEQDTIQCRQCTVYSVHALLEQHGNLSCHPIIFYMNCSYCLTLYIKNSKRIPLSLPPSPKYPPQYYPSPHSPHIFPPPLHTMNQSWAGRNSSWYLQLNHLVLMRDSCKIYNWCLCLKGGFLWINIHIRVLCTTIHIYIKFTFIFVLLNIN